MPTARRSCLLNLAILFCLLAGFAVSVILADAQEALGITPYIWIEYKSYEWQGGLPSYYVGGWWFEDGEYYHVGDWRDFKINYYVYSNILEPWADGRIARLCKLGFRDYDNFASEFFCWPSYQSFLPYSEGR